MDKNTRDPRPLAQRLEAAIESADELGLNESTVETMRRYLRTVPASDRRLFEVAQLVASCPHGDGCASCIGVVAEVASIQEAARA